MEIFIANLKDKLEDDIGKVAGDSNAIKGYDRCIKLVRTSIRALKKYVSEHPFPDQASEIHYFKHITPSFYSRLFYFKMMYNLEVYRITEDEDDFPDYVKNKLETTKYFLRIHGRLHRYFYSEREFRDEELFTRDEPNGRSDAFYCECSRRLACILACERFKLVLKDELIKIAFGAAVISGDDVISEASKSDAVELAAAIHEAGIFSSNGKPLSLKQVIERTAIYFNMELKHYSELDYSNRSRYKISPFLSSLLAFYKSRAERIDDKNHQKR